MSAANALLKVMEEPPAHVHFILTVTNSQSLLPTIRSRAPMFRLRALTQPELVRVLVGQGTPLPQAERIALHANGSHRGLQEQDVALPLDPLRQLLQQGFDPYLVDQIFNDLAADVPAKELNAHQRRLLVLTIDRLISELRGSLRQSHGQQRTMQYIELLLQARSDIRRYIPQRLVIEHLGTQVALG